MRSYIIPIGSRYGSVVLQFLVVAIITRSVPQYEAGQYFLIMGIVWATYFAAGAGLPDGAVRCVPSLAATASVQRADKLLSRILRLSVASVPVGVTLVCIAVWFYAGSLEVALWSGVWWGAYGLIGISAQVLVASGRVNIGTAMFYSAASAGLVVVTVPVILIGQLHTLESVLAATAIGTSLSGGICLTYCWLKCGDDSGLSGSESVREAWTQGVVITTGRVVQSAFLWSPVWITGLILGAADAALVGLAARLVAGVAAVIAAVRFSIRPSLAKDAALGNWLSMERHASRIALLATGFALAAISIFAAVGDPLIGLVFGAEYRGAGPITALMLIGTLGESLGGPVDEILRMSGHVNVVIVWQFGVLMMGSFVQVLAALSGGLAPLLVAYGASFIVLYGAYILTLWRMRRILVLPIWRGC